MNSINQLESCRINLIGLLIRLQTLEAAPVASLSNCAMLLSSYCEGGVLKRCFHIISQELHVPITQETRIPIEVTGWSRFLVMSLSVL